VPWNTCVCVHIHTYTYIHIQVIRRLKQSLHLATESKSVTNIGAEWYRQYQKYHLSEWFRIDSDGNLNSRAEWRIPEKYQSGGTERVGEAHYTGTDRP
jgi:hypothetical protein